MHGTEQVFNTTRIDYTRSSIEVFPAIKDLMDSSELYFKFSKNLLKVTGRGENEFLLMDFDLCLIDRSTNETIIQLFAFFLVSDDAHDINDWRIIELAVAFARSLVADEAREHQLTDKHGNLIVVPEFEVSPESISLYR